MQIHILDCDRVDPDLLPIAGQYGDIFETAFAACRPSWTFQHYDTIGGELPPIQPGDGYIITGSRADSFSDDDWVAALRDWIRAAEKASVAVIGICFGHQIIAQALGGRAGRAGAWGVGRMPAQTHGLPFDVANILVSHQDQVLELPPNAQRLMSSDFCPNFAFRTGHLVGVQGHPEFTPEYSAALANARRARIGNARVDQALASLNDPLNAATVIEWLATELERP